MSQNDFITLLHRFTAAVEAGDDTAFSRLFSEDGEYHDVFYGAFKGRAAIAGMLENYFWRDAEAFRWEMLEPITDGETGYARWRFSFASRLEQAKGKRIFMEGVGYFHLKDGLMQEKDVAAAKSIFSLAFGTFIGVSDPEGMLQRASAGSSMPARRWQGPEDCRNSSRVSTWHAMRPMK